VKIKKYRETVFGGVLLNAKAKDEFGGLLLGFQQGDGMG